MRQLFILIAVLNLLLAPVATALVPCPMHGSDTMLTHKTNTAASTGSDRAMNMTAASALNHVMASDHALASDAMQSPCDCCDDGGCLCQSICHISTTAVPFWPVAGHFLPAGAQSPAPFQSSRPARQPAFPPFRPPIS